jgi:hypothetical protein
MQIALAVILLGHGFAHLPGFLVPWQIARLKEMPYKTTVLADSVNIGDQGVRMVGILWLIAALTFVMSSIGVLARFPGWQSATLIATVFSFFLCIAGWPEARIGVFVNMVIVVFLVVGRQIGWLL